MKKKTIGKQLLAWVLAGAMMPQSSIAYAAETAASALGPKEDILVRWLPEKDQIKAGEEGKVTLEARLNTKRSKVDRVEIEIHLEPEEARALQLEVFDNAEETVDWKDDGSADLYFELDTEHKKLSQKLTFVVPEEVEELFDIDVDRDDITVTPYGDFEDAASTDSQETFSTATPSTATPSTAMPSATSSSIETPSIATPSTVPSIATPSTATPSTATSSNSSDNTRTDVEIDGGVRIRIETRILHVIGEVPEYDLSVTAVEQADEAGTDCFQFQVDAVKQEASSALAVKEQRLSMKLELPEWFSIQQQNVTWNQTTNRLQIDGTDLAEITGIPDSMEVTSAKVSDPQTLEVQMEKAETEDIHLEVSLFHASPLLQISEEVKTAVEHGEPAESVEGQITLAAVLTTTAAGQSTEDEDRAVKNITLAELLKDEAVAVITQKTSLNKQLFWIDNRDESNIRPKKAEEYLQRFKPAITFRVEGETEEIAFTEENWRKYFGNAAMPQLEVSDDLGQISFHDAPTQATWTSPYDGSSKICSITWAMKQTNLEDMGEDGNPNYSGKYSISSLDTENNGNKEGWYYIERRSLKFDIQMRIASLIPSDAAAQSRFWDEFRTSLRKAFGKRYDFYMETSSGTHKYLFETVLDGRNPEFTSGDSTYHFNLGGMWKYDLSGAPVVYSLKDNGTLGTQKDKFTAGELLGEDGNSILSDAGDFLEAIYHNDSVGNFGSVTDALYGGGTMLLQLRGTRSYQATKEWADAADPSHRPSGELQLWRYREGDDYSQASPVRDERGDIKTINLDTTTNSQTIEFGELERYDPEGYLYRYVVKEFLNSSNSYEQVFGHIEVDPAKGKETIQDRIAGQDVSRTYPEQRSGENARNTWLYDGGVLTNRLNKQVTVTGTKIWQASTFQDDLSNVEVQMTLYYKGKDSAGKNVWKKVTQPAEVTETLMNFRAENESGMQVTRTMPRYDAYGQELIYRWFETKTVQNGTDNGFEEVPEVIPDAAKMNRSFSLEHRGQMVPYVSENTFDEATGVSTIYNRVVDTRDYVVEKQWDGVEPRAITFYLHRTIGGLKHETLGKFSFKADGSLADGFLAKKNTLSPITAEQLEAWRVKLRDLPRYDEKGRTYEYFLAESDSSDSLPVYDLQVDEDGTYSSLIVNRPVDGTSNSIMIHKDWIDDGDSAHRSPVTIGVYDKETNEQIGGDVVIGDNEIWIRQVSIGAKKPSEVYVVEKKVGKWDVLTDESGKRITPEQTQIDGTQVYRTDQHEYKVSYTEPDQAGSVVKSAFTIKNRRVGSVNFTLTKKWVDGGGSIRTAIKNAVEQINEAATEPSKKIHWILQLGFSSIPDTSEYPGGITGAHYQLTREKASGDTVKINQDGVIPIYKDHAGTAGNSWYDLLENQGSGISQTAEYHFYHLPKYDYAGAVMNYQAVEIWVDGNGNPVNPAKYSYLEGGVSKSLATLLADYQSAYTKNEYVVGAQHTNDSQTVEITNRLTAVKNIHWHKQWHDNYNYDSQLRPDIYLDIYRKSDAPGSQLEKYEDDYQWTYQNASAHPDSSISKRHHWVANIYDVDKYDAQGYEWHYYAKEKTKVDKSKFDYTEVQYSRWSDENDPSTEKKLGTESKPAVDAGKQVQLIPGTTEEYALGENGTFINSIAGTVVIDGQKIWAGLPSAYLKDSANRLPAATFDIDQTVEVFNEGDNTTSIITKKVATLPIKNWDDIKDDNGFYKFSLEYTGNYTVDRDGIHKATDGSAQLIPRYNERGDLYTYNVRETMNWTGDWPAGQDRGDIRDVYITTIQTFLVTNSYDSVKGALRIKKYLSLPKSLESSRCPAISMVLTRSYQNADGILVKDTEFKKEQVWNAGDVKTAFEAAKTGAAVGNNVVLCSTKQTKDPFLFENLDIYAPNGAKYQYQVEEKRDDYLYGFHTWAGAGDLTDEAVKDNSLLGSYVVEGLYPTMNQADAAGKDGRGTTSGSVPVTATYRNELQTVGETVELSGIKEWDEYTFQSSKRPAMNEFAGWLKLYRSARSQPGQNNAIAEEPVEHAEFIVTAEAGGNPYRYTVTGTTDGSKLDRYAPNGMLWNYVVKETIPVDSPYQAKDGKTTAEKQSSSTTPGSSVTTITLKPLTNTTKINVSYSKTWVDAEGNAIQDDYAGLGNLKVTFKLQVKEQGQTSWTDAKNYFTGTKALTGVVDFEPSISGSLTSDVWGKDHWMEDLPAFVLSDTTGDVKPLSYRMTETGVYQNGSATPLVTWTETDTNELGYTLIGSGAATALITPYYPNGHYKLNDNNNHFNKLKLGSMTVKKTWVNDRNNLWSTRQPTKRPGYDWELKLLIQRKTENETNWSNVKSYDKDGTEKGDLLVTFYGPNQDAEMSRTITGLTACNEKGKPYTYRAVELDPENNQGLEEGAAYRKTYQVSYVSNDITVNTEASNRLQTVEICAAKSWLAGDSSGKTVTLQLKYRGTDGKLHAIGNLSGAKVTLDGTKDTKPDDSSAQFGYEEDAWKAVWTVPKVLPAELFTDHNAEAEVDSVKGSTIYVVEELNSDDPDHTGYHQLSHTATDNQNYEILNEKLMKLSIQKTWYTVNNNARKPLTFQIYRIAGADEIPDDDTGAYLLGTVTLTGSAQEQTWSWSGYSCTDAAGTKQFFSKYNSSGTPYLYYAREIAIGGESIGEARKVTAGGYRYEVVTPTVKMVPPTNAQGVVTDPDKASASFINLQLTDISATKVWKDHNNAYKTRPENLDLQLWRKGKSKPEVWEQVSTTPEIQKDNSSGKWVYTWKDVPYYNPVDGKSFRYEVWETVPPISTPTDPEAAGAWYASGDVKTGGVATALVFGKATITNTLKGQIQVTGTKIWKDEDRTSRPSDITLTLYRWSDRSSEVNREKVTTANVPAMTLTWENTETNEWKYTYSNLPQFDSYGALYHYKVEETTPAHYRTEYKDALGREIHNLGLVTFHVEKKWETEDAAQKEITVGIYRTTGLTIPADSSKDGTGSSELIGQITLNSGNNWKWSGDSLHGTAFAQRTYGAAEEKPYLYYARELQIGSTGVPAGKAGRLVEADGYRYAVKEEMTPSALTASQAVPDSMTTVITNTQLTDLTVVKNWMDNHNQYNTRPNTPDDLELTLYRRAEGDTNVTKLTDAELTGITLEKTAGTGTEANRWTYTWKNLPATDQNGTSYTYYVWETVPAINPDSTLHGAAYGGRQYVCSQGTDPAYPTEISKDADTSKTNISRRADLTNVLTAHGISLSGTKHWADGAVDRPDTLELRLWRSLDGETTETEISYEPQSAGSTANPQLLWSQSGSTWTYTFINLDGYDTNGVRYHYRVEEIVPDGYRNVVLTDADYSGLEDLVNIRQVQFQVEKKWRVREDSLKHPVHMKLYRTTDGQIPETSAGDAASEFLGEVSLEETNGWKWSGDQILDAHGDRIYFDKYRVLDEHGQLLSAPEQYLYYAREIVTDTGFLVTEAAELATASNATAVVTNQQLTDLTVVKEWLDHGNAYKTRPDHLELTLYRQTEGGQREKITDRSPKVQKSAGNQWVYTWKDMPVQDVDGNPYTYDVEEQAPTVAEGARLLGASYVCLENQPVKLTNDQGKLTNYLKKETDLVGRKTWNDGQYAGRPTTVQLHLYRQADGESTWEEVTGAMPVWYRNSDDTWSFVYERISRTNASGAEYRYKVEEEVPKDYRVSYSKDSDGNQVLLENVGDGSLTLTKEVTGSGGEPFREFHFTITVGTLPDGSKLPDGVYGEVSFRDGKAAITLKSGESVRADHLPGMVSYTVTEEEANLDRYRTTSEADQGVIQPFVVTEVKFTNSRTSDDKDCPVKPSPANTTTTGYGPGAIPGPAQTEQVDDDQSKKTENHIGLWVIPKTGDETPILRDILIMAAAVAVLAVLLIFRKKKKK